VRATELTVGSAPYAPGMYVVRGLLHALVLLAGCSVAALAAGGLWWVLQDGGLRAKVGMAMLIIAACMAVSGGNVLTRSGTAETNALLGTGPEHEDAPTNGALTGVGIFLFVAVPLFVAGGVLYGTG
jgi:hypothetical protein